MPIFDQYKDIQPSLSGPVEGDFDIPPADDADLVQMTSALVVETGGDVVVTLKTGGGS